MTRILGLSGSLRQGSYNTALLRAAATMTEGRFELELASIRGIPLYDGDREAAEGIPDAVAELKARVVACDGLILATPEYNNGIPGAFKNALDWLSRPPADTAKVFADLPVALIGATPGGFGTILAHDHWLPVLRALGTRPWFGGRLLVARAGKLFDGAGELTDENTRTQLREFLRGFVAFVERGRPA
ncbi:MAG: NADPH-dependent FMN reductase [Panacagrimonas sp.]